MPADNPYFNFLRRPEKKAAVWRPKVEPKTEEGMDKSVLLNPNLVLSKKAAIITNKITTEFCEWLRGLGGIDKSNITEKVLAQLFEIGFDMPAARSLCVRIREMPVVTAAVAKATKMPKAELRMGLRRELRRDIRAEKREPRLVAFGRAMPVDPPLRFKPPTNRVQENWLEVHTVPPELASMAEVWDGITNLRSVKTYCKWLKGHPEIPLPPYLVEQGLLGPKQRRRRAPMPSIATGHYAAGGRLPSRIRDKSGDLQTLAGLHLAGMHRQSLSESI